MPDAALGSDQGGRYLLVVNKDNVVEQRKVEIGQVVGDMRVIEKGLTAGRSRHRRRNPARHSGPEGRSEAAIGGSQTGRRARREVTDRAMISKFFIERPVLANVLAILMVVIGAVALYRLPVAQYPDVVPPTVQVTTRYPGASARTVIDTVALPIEQQVNGVEGMIYMQSYAAADGSYTLTVTFKIGTDLNFAQVLVQNRVSSALSSLAAGGAGAGRHRAEEVDRDPADRHADLAGRPLRQPLSQQLRHHPAQGRDRARCPASATSCVFGAGQYSMRIWLDPNKMKARGLTPQDVIQALQQQSEQVTAGQIGMPPTPDNQSFQYTLNVLGRLDDPEQFADVIVKTGSAGELTRVRDVGRVELGAQTYGQIFTLDGKPAAGMAIFQTPGANALDVGREVQGEDGRARRASFRRR